MFLHRYTSIIASTERMSWDSIIGQKRVKTVLRSAIAAARVPHAWLFSGAEGIGKDAAAIVVAQALRCENLGLQAEPCGECRGCTTTASLQNSNVKFVFALPSGKGEDSRSDSPMMKLSDSEISLIREQIEMKAADYYHNISVPRAQQIKISSIREIRRDVSLSTMEPGWRVIIVSEAHLMRDEAANAFLKTLEEPAPRTLLILTTSHRERLLPTIVSRCQEIRFDLLSEEEIADALAERQDIEKTPALLLAKLADGSYSRAVELASGDLNQLRFDVVSFMRGALRRSPLAAYAEIERLTSNNDRTHLERTLSLLALWLRDALALRLTQNDTLIVNSDQLKDIASFNSNFAQAPLDRMITNVEESIRAVRSNAQIPLIFTVLSMQLSDACYQSR